MYFIRHVDKAVQPSEERWFPYSEKNQAVEQATHDLSLKLPVEGIYEGEPNSEYADRKKVMSKSDLK
jgi:hypothetical protein